MARPKKYHSEEARKEAQRAAKRKYKAKLAAVGGTSSGPSDTKPREPKSWVKKLERKLEVVGTDDNAPMPERAGEPFADLPPLDLPASPSDVPTGDAAANDSASDAGNASNASSPTPSPEAGGKTRGAGTKTESEIFDTAQLEAMATQIAHDGVMMLGQYAAERKYFALGEPFAKLAGVAAGVLVRVHAKNVGISDEEAAAWVLGGVVGVNGVQAFRAYRAETEAKSASEKARFDDRRKAAEEARKQTGIPNDPESGKPVDEKPNVPTFASGVV